MPFFRSTWRRCFKTLHNQHIARISDQVSDRLQCILVRGGWGFRWKKICVIDFSAFRLLYYFFLLGIRKYKHNCCISYTLDRKMPKLYIHVIEKMCFSKAALFCSERNPFTNVSLLTKFEWNWEIVSLLTQSTSNYCK